MTAATTQAHAPTHEIGSLGHVELSLREAQGDWRWRSQILTLAATGEDAAASMCLHLSTGHALAKCDPGRALRRIGITSSHVALLGGFARGYGGGWSRPSLDPWRADDNLERLIRSGARVGRDEGRELAALSVPEGQVAAFVRAWPDRARVERADAWFHLDVPRTTSLTDFVARLPRKMRQVWVRDGRDFDELGADVEIAPMDDGIVQEAAPLVAQVSNGNGVDSDPRLVVYQLRQWRDQTDAEHVVFGLRDKSGELLGACFARAEGRVLDLCELGMAPTHPRRRALYSALLFQMPTRWAIERRFERIDYGCAHPVPKSVHGCTPTKLFDICSALSYDPSNTLRPGGQTWTT